MHVFHTIFLPYMLVLCTYYCINFVIQRHFRVLSAHVFPVWRYRKIKPMRLDEGTYVHTRSWIAIQCIFLAWLAVHTMSMGPFAGSVYMCAYVYSACMYTLFTVTAYRTTWASAASSAVDAGFFFIEISSNLTKQESPKWAFLKKNLFHRNTAWNTRKSFL